jgi:hypothetical protein
MANTLVKRVLLQITADDGTTEEKLARISAKADELGRKHPELKVRIDTAAASAKVAVLRKELKGLSDAADAEAARGGILSRFLGFGKGFAGGISSVLGSLPGLGGGGAAGAAETPGGPQGMAAAATILGVSLPELVTEATALVSGFAAAGAGAGAFYLLAHPAINNLTNDVQGLDKANQALGIAQQKALIDPTKANLKALHNAQVTYQAIYQQMGQDAGSSAAGVLKLHDTYVKLSNAFTPEAFKVFNGVLQIANNLLPSIVPFANAFAGAMTRLLGQAAKFTESKGFKDWLTQFEKLAGPSTMAIGVGIGHLVANFGKLLTLMSAKDVVNGINIAFSVLDGTIILTVRAIRSIMQGWDLLTAGWDRGIIKTRALGHVMASTFDFVRHAIAHDADSIVHAFQGIVAGAARLLGGIVRADMAIISVFASIPRRILSALGNLGSLLYNAGQQVIQGLINGISSMFGSLGSIVSSIGSGILGGVKSMLGIGSPSRVMRQQGIWIGEGLALGLEDSVARVQRGARRIAAATMPGGYAQPALATAGGYRGGHLTFEVIGDSNQVLTTLLKRNIRVRGGDPGVLGR